MALRFGIGLFALAFYFGVASTGAAQQVVRFETSIGHFDMVLNPTRNPRLQGHVDNMIQYVENGSYNNSWINRAAEGFVLQMGGFYSHTLRPPMTFDSTRPVHTFDPVLGQPMISGLSNTLGTVSLALPDDGMGGTNENAGTSSFFVNLGDNSGLDGDFTVFAAVPDMTVINQIMALTQQDLTRDPLFGADPRNLAFIDVPLQENGFQVFIERAFVISDSMAVVSAISGVQETMAASALAASAASNAIAAGGGSAVSPSTSASSPLGSLPVPEPGGLVLACLAGGALLASRRRHSRRAV